MPQEWCRQFAFYFFLITWPLYFYLCLIAFITCFASLWSGSSLTVVFFSCGGDAGSCQSRNDSGINASTLVFKVWRVPDVCIESGFVSLHPERSHLLATPAEMGEQHCLFSMEKHVTVSESIAVSASIWKFDYPRAFRFCSAKIKPELASDPVVRLEWLVCFVGTNS